MFEPKNETDEIEVCGLDLVGRVSLSAKNIPPEVEVFTSAEIYRQRMSGVVFAALLVAGRKLRCPGRRQCFAKAQAEAFKTNTTNGYLYYNYLLFCIGRWLRCNNQ